MTTPRSVLIIGGGVAGLSAAKALDGSGIAVHLLEKRDRLGGKAFDWACMATDVCQNCGACLAAEMVQQVQGLARTTIHQGSELASLQRRNGGFRATLKGLSEACLEIDAILLATGLAPFDPTGFESLGYADHGQVITTAELNAALKQDRLAQILAGRTAPSIAFVQCVGSRNRTIGRDYCSQVCCKTSIRQANKLLHLCPGAQITIFHLDLQVIGKEFRTQWAHLAGRVKFRQGVPAEVLSGYQEGKLTVIREDDDSGARLAHHFDLIVLAVGIEPSAGLRETAALLGATPDEWGFFGGAGASLPQGVYLAGAAASPTDILSAAAQGQIAARKIVGDLIPDGRPVDPPDIAVVGSGPEARTVVQAVARAGYPVRFLDPDEGQAPGGAAVHYYPNCRLLALEGTCGRFSLKLEVKAAMETVNVAAIIVADGIQRSAAAFEDGPHPPEMITDLSTFSARLTANPQAVPQRIVFWLDHDGPEWKENCRKALQLARELAGIQRTVGIIMDKMLVHRLSGQRNYDLARKQGIKFLRLVEGSRPKITAHGSGVAIEIRETTLPTVALGIACDLLVVAEKVQPSPRSTELARLLGLSRDSEGYLQAANVRHRPVASPRRGIFFAGSCHDENDGDDFEREIQAVLAGLAQPRDGAWQDAELPHIDEGRCVRCLTCLRICPHAAITLKNWRQPEIAPAACFNCGWCVANCPAQAIDPVHLDLTAQLGEAAPETVVFACRRSAALAAGEAAFQGLDDGAHTRIIPVNCAGRLNVETLLEPMLRGSRRVLVAACHDGNCRSSVGGRSAAAQVARIVDETRLPAATFCYHSIAANEPARFASLLSGNQAED